MSAARRVADRKRKWNGEPLVLFVEGYSDLTFYAEMFEHLGLHDRCFIQDLGGKGRTQLLEQAQLLLKPDNLRQIRAVAVVLDADESSEGAFSLARSALKKAVGLDIPAAGEWVEGPEAGVRYGIFIVGGPDQKGEVESLAWSAWSRRPENAAFRGCVEDYVKCAADRDRQLKSIDKVRIGVVLSVLNEDDPRLGPGARAKVFDFEAKEFAALRQSLKAMAGLGGAPSGVLLDRR